MSLKINKKNNNNSGILLLAKNSGETSFSSLTAVKKALGTTKVGHTGTLDSFADGLLVVLSGSLTRLVPHITNFDKTYLALIEFGTETDTLELTGNVISKGKIPTEEDVQKSLEKFLGTTKQVPPLYSAIHVDGKRASDLARSGKTADIPPRDITIHSIKLIDFFEKYALIEVSCSKGTYIRSLARDIAKECGTVAHLCALRRVSVGPFNLKDAAGFSSLPEFTIPTILKNLNKAAELKTNFKDSDFLEEIRKCNYSMTKELSKFCGFDFAELKINFEQDFYHGRPIKTDFFCNSENFPEKSQIAVFYNDKKFAGLITKNKNKYSYGFVIHDSLIENKVLNNDFAIYNWNDILSGRFNEDFKNIGTALSIGSFDGPHLGHFALFDACIKQNELYGYIPGVITFSKSLRGMKVDSYKGDVASLEQRLRMFKERKLHFAVVIDFSSEFGKMSGTDFLSLLVEKCGMKFLAEGDDFRCGYKGSTNIQSIKDFSYKSEFNLDVIAPVDYQEKRVNSSRIREAVLEKQFQDVSVMLNRLYELDCSSLDWSCLTENNQCSYVAEYNGYQVLPPNGEYLVNVVISGSEEVSIIKHLTCKLDSGVLRLLVSDGSLKGFIKAIQFC